MNETKEPVPHLLTEITGHTILPPRLMSRRLMLGLLAGGATAAAIGLAKEHQRKAPAGPKEHEEESLEDLIIKGSEEFTRRSKAALQLLTTTSYYDQVKQYLPIIEESAKSGVYVYGEKPVYQVGQATWSSTTEWYAGTIVHDSQHSRLYHEAKAAAQGKEPKQTSWTGREAEIVCLDTQYKALQELKVSERILNYVAELKKNPTYQDVPYDRRSW